jgi:7-carboxy-7-deazaguanine synthase
MAKNALDRSSRDRQLRITEIFHSLQGESRPMGCPSAFIRLTGCPLRCAYCDTAYAFHGGTKMSVTAILDRIAGFATRHVCVTGGEPLAQPGCLRLLSELCDLDYEVTLETSGALDIGPVDPRVTIVMDIKTPASGEAQKNLWDNVDLLKRDDQVKFVIADRADYEWSRDIVAERELSTRCAVLFSPTWGGEIARKLAEWILADRLDVRFQIQLHKVLWGDAPGH